MSKLKKISTFAIIFLAGFIALNATDSNLDIKGTKSFSLNRNVGPVELKFISSAPLEEIIGYADAAKVKSYLNIDPANLEKANGKIAFPTNSIETGIQTRDEHLYGDTWLAADKYPEISFELKELRNVKVKGIDKPAGRSTIEATAIGLFNMHGKSKQISAQVTIIYIKESENTKKRASGDLISIEGNFSLQLKDFDVTGKKGIVGSKVGETINISLKLYYNSK